MTKAMQVPVMMVKLEGVVLYRSLDFGQNQGLDHQGQGQDQGLDPHGQGIEGQDQGLEVQGQGQDQGLKFSP